MADLEKGGKDHFVCLGEKSFPSFLDYFAYICEGDRTYCGGTDGHIAA